MERGGRRSLLQTRILAELKAGPTTSITNLAKAIDADRSAVSRSLSILAEHDLVQRAGRRWQLTDAGHSEAAASVAKLKESTTGLIKATSRRYEALSRVVSNDAERPPPYLVASADLIDHTRRLWESSGALDYLATDYSKIVAGQFLEPGQGIRDAIASMSSIGDAVASAVEGRASMLSAFDAGEGAATATAFSVGSAIREALDADISRHLATPIPGIDPGETFLAHRLASDFVEQLTGTTTEISLAMNAMNRDAMALSRSVEALTTSREMLSTSIGAAASDLLGWGQLSKSAAEPLWDLSSETSLQRVLDLAELRTPEPLMSDVLRVAGLDAEIVHTPTFIIPAVEPMTTKQDVFRRKERATQRKISDASDTVTAVERGLRRLSQLLLSQHYGSFWWSRCVPDAIRDDCEERKRIREAKGGMVEHPIHYTYLGQLKEIIVHRKNWSGAFACVFRDKRMVERAFSWIEPVRQDCSHARASSKNDFVLFKAGATWLLNEAKPVLDCFLEVEFYDS